MPNNSLKQVADIQCSAFLHSYFTLQLMCNSTTLQTYTYTVVSVATASKTAVV